MGRRLSALVISAVGTLWGAPVWAHTAPHVTELPVPIATPATIGGIEVGAGQSLSIPFSRVQTFQLACSAHPSGQLRISVSAKPEPSVGRLWWRIERLRG